MKVKNFSKLSKIAGWVLLASAPFQVQADLIDENINGFNFVYDSVTNTTWTQNANYSAQSYTWQDANSWAANLSFAGVDTATGWQLPNSTQLTSLYTQLEPYGAPGSTSNKYGSTVSFGAGANDFVANVQLYYWTNTSATDFNFAYGYQGSAPNSNLYSAWAVADIPAPVSPVPVPAAFWLFGSAMAGFSAITFRRKDAQAA